jgi:hypothetical protein
MTASFHKLLSLLSIKPLEAGLSKYLRIWSVLERKHGLLTVAAFNWLRLFKEIITAYNENHTKLINTSLTLSLSTVSVCQGMQQIRILCSLMIEVEPVSETL